MTPTSIKIDAGLWALCAAAMAFAAVLAAPLVLSGSDLYWHIAAGRWMIDNQAVLRIDPFSYTYAGQPWEPREWLADVLLAFGYVGAGWSGVVVLSAAAAASAAGLLAFHLAQGRRDSLTLIWLGLALVTAAGAVTALPFLLALPCLVAWTGWLVRAGEKGPPLRLLPVMLVWANLSPSFVIGLILVFVLAAEAVIRAPKDQLTILRSWAVFAGGALILSLITPTGVVGLAHALRTLVAVGPLTSVLPLLIALPAAAMLLPRARNLFRLLFLVGLFVLALTSPAGRLFFAAAAPLLAAGPAKDEAPQPLRLRPLLALIVIVVVATGVRLVVPVIRADDGFAPGTALARVPVALKRQAVLNATAFGGFLIFHDVKPFIDSRPLYSASLLRRYGERGTPDLLAKTLTRYHIRWTILAPADPAIRVLDGLAGWHRLYTDQLAVVHVKNDARY